MHQLIALKCFFWLFMVVWRALSFAFQFYLLMIHLGRVYTRQILTAVAKDDDIGTSCLFFFFSFCLSRCSGTLLYFIGLNNLCYAWLFTQKCIVEATIHMPNENVSKYCQGFLTLFIMFSIVSWKIVFSCGWKKFLYKISHTYFIHAHLIWQYLN